MCETIYKMHLTETLKQLNQFSEILRKYKFNFLVDPVNLMDETVGRKKCSFKIVLKR